MAIPATPTGFSVQQGNGKVFLSWDITTDAISYLLKRSTDGITYAAVGGAIVNPFFLDSTVTVGQTYYYQLAGHGTTGDSAYTAAPATPVIPTNSGIMSLGQVRLESQQRADRENSQFLTKAEWNRNIVQSYFELYDLLVTLYEDYFVKGPVALTTVAGQSQVTLPIDFYKLQGVDLGIDPNGQAWVSVKKFNFEARNRYVFPQLTTSPLGAFDLRYRLVGNTLMFIPAPGGGQFLRLWYTPRLVEPLQDTDMLDGVSGWIEYVITDAAIKALQKEESDVSILAMQKMALIKRIEETAMNRDESEPDTISDTRGTGSYNSPYGDGGYGGY